MTVHYILYTVRIHESFRLSIYPNSVVFEEDFWTASYFQPCDILILRSSIGLLPCKRDYFLFSITLPVT